MAIWLTPAAYDRLQQELDALRRYLDTGTQDDPNAIAVRRAPSRAASSRSTRCSSTPWSGGSAQ